LASLIERITAIKDAEQVSFVNCWKYNNMIWKKAGKSLRKKDKRFSDQNEAPFFETSAKFGINSEEIFLKIFRGTN
jgi:hypothetical protein